jgi:hypothetical protein
MSGLSFMFADAEEPPVMKQRTAEELESQKKARLAGLERGRDTNRKKVICLDTGQEFSSLTEASTFAGVTVTSVTASIIRSGRAGGYRFVFAENA